MGWILSGGRKKIDRAWLEIDREAVVCEFEFGSALTFITAADPPIR